MIEIISPAGFEHFFWGLADQLTDGPPDPEELARLAAMHGLVFQDAPLGPRPGRAVRSDAPSTSIDGRQFLGTRAAGCPKAFSQVTPG